MGSTTTDGRRAAGDGGDDADGVAVFGGSGFLREVTDVFVVDVDIDKAAEFAVFGEEVLAQIAELRCEFSWFITSVHRVDSFDAKISQDSFKAN